MRLATTMYSYERTDGPVIFKDGNIEKNVELMKKYGFDGTDLFIQDVTHSKIIEYRNIFESNDVEVVTLFAIFLGQNGVNLAEKDKIKREKNITLLKNQLDNSVIIGSHGLGCGYIRGNHDNYESEQDALLRIADALSVLGEYAASVGTKILLEPINRYEINTLNSGKNSVDFIKKNKLKGVALLLDLFHMNIEDKSFKETFRYADSLIENIHVSDSNRGIVGEGHLDFEAIIKSLCKTGYKGFLTLEAFADDAENAMMRTATVLKPLIKKYDL